MVLRLRLRFIYFSTLALMIILLSVIGVLNSGRYYQIRMEIQSVLRILSNNEGVFPSTANKEPGEFPADYNYFSVKMSEEEEVLSSDFSHIFTVSEETGRELIRLILASGRNRGYLEIPGQRFAFQVARVHKTGEILVSVLDISMLQRGHKGLVNLSLGLFFGSFLFFICVVTVLSGKVVRPFMENYEKQKRFITNAGHELKTPLAIISANTEMEEMLTGETEWSKSTKDQVVRMTKLINQMVSLARLEEKPDLVLSEVDFSAIALDAAEDFKAPILRAGKEYILDISPGILCRAEEKSLFELVTILVDNAGKYCDEGGRVTVSLSQTKTAKKKARLMVSNTFREGKHVDYQLFFERFYREDVSRNTKLRSGFGIGLSMAEGIVHAFKGKISVSYQEETITFTVVIP